LHDLNETSFNEIQSPDFGFKKKRNHMNEKQFQILSPSRYNEMTDDNMLSPKIFLKNTP
jgi:hypothetical protein